ncbi:histidine kinase [Arthrobacter sp. H35-D1]|uniref:sensor histidine kinase n=1 Tax=Arthrobacter sp. H35-D1 TaxID=3046202 RepID=UPI0024B8C288|nr:histidine kinase [Arthrobacter sp. H35-D1]MDJ0312829.1 histidine kinase [Arthrobacter sp. H35-D1]
MKMAKGAGTDRTGGSASAGTGAASVTGTGAETQMPFSTVHLWRLKGISWVWLGTAVVCIALLAVGAPLNMALYNMALPFALGMSILHSASLGLTAARPVAGALVSLVPLAVLPLVSDPIGGAPMPFSVVAMITQVLVICVAGLRSHWMVPAVAWLGSVIVGVVANYLTMPGGQSTGAQTNVVIFAAVAGGLMMASVVAQQWQHLRVELAAERTVSAEEQSRRRLAEERTRIARELHDVVAHGMSVVVVQATTASYRHSGLSPELKQEFDDIAASSRRAMMEMRSMLGSLRNAEVGRELGPQPTLADLPQLFASARSTGVRIEDPALPDGERYEIGEVIALTTYRIVQEALSNVIRHAPGASVQVEFTVEAGMLAVSVVNSSSAVGAIMAQLDKGPHLGQGLIGMRERADIVGGSVVCTSTADGGFSVTARLPMSTSTANPKNNKENSKGSALP